MDRTQAIIVGDIHLRETAPECRTDDWGTALEKKLNFLRKLQNKNGGVPILCAGDIFDKARPPLSLVRWTIEQLSGLTGPFITVAGNHDMPAHNAGLLEKSGLGVLEAAGVVDVFREGEARNMGSFHLFGFPWGTAPAGRKGPSGVPSVSLVHAMVYMKDPPWPGVEGWEAEELIKRMGTQNLIITGHNHQRFTAKSGGTVLVNPGSVFRISADQGEHRPCAYLWNGEDVKVAPFPTNRHAVSREHLEVKAERDERIQTFVRHLSAEYEVGLSFERNLETFLGQNTVRPAIHTLLEEALHE